MLRKDSLAPLATMLTMVAILCAIGAASFFAKPAGAASVAGGTNGRLLAAPTFTPISTPLPKGDPAAGRVIDRQVWIEHVGPAVIFSAIIWFVTGAVALGIFTTGRHRGPTVPGRADVEGPTRG